MNDLIPTEPCAACGAPGCDGEFSIEDSQGNERALCSSCAGPDAQPDVQELRKIIANRDSLRTVSMQDKWRKYRDGVYPKGTTAI